MREFKKIFKRVRGFKVLNQYARAGVLLYAVILTMLLGISQKSLEIVRLAVENRVLSKIRRKYSKFIVKFKEKQNNQKIQENSNKVWVCWLQGMENAPEIVKHCYRSLEKHLVNKEIIVITDSNYNDYVSFPKHIQEKVNQGTISKTHFSDLLRLELLINYGGSWIDATVLCTSDDIPEYIFESNLFLYQCLKPGRDGHSYNISSWFITSSTNHPILELTKELLYEYWKQYNYMKDYYLLHMMFQLAIETYNMEWEEVIPCCNSTPHILLLNLFNQYDEKKYKAILNATPFHKLSYKFTEEDSKKESTFYCKVRSAL